MGNELFFYISENCVLITLGQTIRLFIMRFFHLMLEEFERMAVQRNCAQRYWNGKGRSLQFDDGDSLFFRAVALRQTHKTVKVSFRPLVSEEPSAYFGRAECFGGTWHAVVGDLECGADELERSIGCWRVVWCTKEQSRLRQTFFACKVIFPWQNARRLGIYVYL